MDAEKVKKVVDGLEHCAERSKCNNECPYSDIIQDQNEGMDSCITQLSKDALSVIRGLQAAIPRWISVEERLPDDYEKVLIFDKKWGILPGWHSKSYWETSEVKNVTEITHWMPKPTPPKEDEKNG